MPKQTKTSTAGNPSQNQKRTTYTYWVTRDSDPETGIPYDHCRVWVAKPQRYTLGRGAFWMPETREEDLFGTWTLEQTHANAKTYPDDDRMSIRVEGDQVKGPDDKVDRS